MLRARAAKNVILAGVKSVTVHDTAEAQLRDLAAQFYLSKADVGRNRAEACRDRLQELNTAVAVTASAAALSQDFLSQFQVRYSSMHQFPMSLPYTGARMASPWRMHAGMHASERTRTACMDLNACSACGSLLPCARTPHCPCMQQAGILIKIPCGGMLVT